MEDTTYNKILKVTLVVAAAFALSACGETKSFNPGDNTDLGSTTPVTAAKAVCSKNLDLTDTKLQVAAYYDSAGQYYPNKFRVKMANVPSDWKSTDYDMVVRLMAASANGTLTQGSTLPMTVETRTGNGYQQVNAGPYPVFDVSHEGYGLATFIGATPTTTAVADYQPQTLFNFNGTHLVVTSSDSSGAFQVLRMELHSQNLEGS